MITLRPSRADSRVVSAEVPPCGRALGMSRGMFQRVAGYSHDVHVGP
jgi:hypothetical protein